MKEDFPDLEDIEKYYLHNGGEFIIAQLNASVIATIACDKLDEKCFVLKRMFVNKKYRQQGVEQKLLDLLIQNLWQKESNKKLHLYLSTNATLALAAKQFYTKNAFYPIEKSSLPNNFPLFYDDDLFMVRSIN